jgi:hypothetical protein
MEPWRALGSQSFVETVQAKMGIKAMGRRSRESRRDAYELRETVESYGNENSYDLIRQVDRIRFGM